MRYLAVACDYDGTLAQDGRVAATTVAALQRLRGSGRLLILVTGRQLEDLLGVFGQVSLFERVVAENGAVLYHPATREIKTLTEPPAQSFIDALRQRKVAPLSVGRAIVATWKPHETAVLEAIRDLGLDLQVIFNKDAVMVLPAGINKATGLSMALKELGLSPHEVVGIGDAENDHAFLSLCECAVAVDNALPTVKERADLVTPGDHGRGVEQLIQRLLNNDLQDLEDQLSRHLVLLGHRADGTEVRFSPFAGNLLIAGPSGSGKSTISKSFLERLQEQHYQFCIVDPEGDYEGLEGAVTTGNSKHGPAIDEVLQLLKKPDANVVANLIGLPLADRPPFFHSLLPRLQEMRAQVGRPHWIIVDEAHHLLPAAWGSGLPALPRQLQRMALITVHPDQVMRPALEAMSSLIAVGPEPLQVISRFCKAVNASLPQRRTATGDVPFDEDALRISKQDEVVYWPRQQHVAPYILKVIPARAEHRRHVRKYAEGALPDDRCFYFRGPDGKLNLKAQNLVLFNQIAEGVDDATWLYHLRQGDYSRWFREGIHDDALADEAAKIERATPASAAQSRLQIKKLIEQYYTVPESTSLPLPGTQAEPKKT